MSRVLAIGLVGAALLPGIAASFEEETAPYAATQDAALAKADRFEQNNQYEEALPIYEHLIDEGSGRDIRWTGYLLFRLSCAQAECGDRAGALESVSAAVDLDPEEPSYQAFLTRLQERGSGRERSRVYHAHRNEGSARRLVSSNGVLHIFVHGRNTERWDDESKNKVQADVAGADEWLRSRAAENRPQANPTFEHRYLAVEDEPFWRKTAVPETASSDDYRRAWLNEVLLRFQASSLAELFDRVFDGKDFENRCVVFHTSTREITMALSPYHRETRDLESAFTATQQTDWVNPFGSVLYARELAHLYGADDLANKVSEATVPENDLMNFGAHRLDDCVLCPLTRYAIGWTDQPPKLARLQVAALSHPQKPKKGTHG